MGLQSCNDEFLEKIGRIHNFSMFESAYKAAAKAGFDNFNLDLIYGLPQQTMAEWQNDLKTAAGFGCGHISLYPLSIEEDTPFFNSNIKTDENLQRDMYEEAVNFLSENGFAHYEISNWAKPGKESLHNSNYWRNMEYIAIGAGAAGYENRFRYSNMENIEKYAEFISKGLSVKEENDFIDDENYEIETIMLGLRMLNEGVDIKAFKKRENADTLQKLLARRMLINENGRIKLPKNMVFTSNAVMSEFMK